MDTYGWDKDSQANLAEPWKVCSNYKKKKKTLSENLSLNHRFRNVCVINKYEYVRKVQKKKKTVFVE